MNWNSGCKRAWHTSLPSVSREPRYRCVQLAIASQQLWLWLWWSAVYQRNHCPRCVNGKQLGRYSRSAVVKTFPSQKPKVPPSWHLVTLNGILTTIKKGPRICRLGALKGEGWWLNHVQRLRQDMFPKRRTPPQDRPVQYQSLPKTIHTWQIGNFGCSFPNFPWEGAQNYHRCRRSNLPRIACIAMELGVGDARNNASRGSGIWLKWLQKQTLMRMPCKCSLDGPSLPQSWRDKF